MNHDRKLLGKGSSQDTNGNMPSTVIQPVLDTIAGDAKTPILILCAAVFLLMLVACANVANLLLVRGSERRQEFAMRAALGASKLTILRQWLWESMALGFIGSGIGLLAAFVSCSDDTCDGCRAHPKAGRSER